MKREVILENNINSFGNIGFPPFYMRTKKDKIMRNCWCEISLPVVTIQYQAMIFFKQLTKRRDFIPWLDSWSTPKNFPAIDEHKFLS